MGKIIISTNDKEHQWLIHLENQYLHGDMSEEFYLLQLEQYCLNYYL